MIMANGFSRSAGQSVRISILSSRSALEQSLRRLKPEKHLKALTYRNRIKLPFLVDLQPPFPKLLLDTTVYIDTLQGKIPDGIAIALRAGSLWHSSVTEAELAALSGLLDPTRSDTESVIAKIAEVIERRPVHRTLTPDREIWREAGILAGLLARLQSYGRSEQRKAFNDALIFLTAAKNGCTVLTRNVGDFDLLNQLYPSGHVIFYDIPS
jgi:predicted nucleic acid-binding protein